MSTASDRVSACTVQVEGGPAYVQQAGDRVMRSALRAGVAFPYECNAGTCGCCRFELVSGEVAVAWPEAPAWSERDKRKGRYLGCQCSALTDCVIRVAQEPRVRGAIAPQRRRATLVRKRFVTHDMCMLALQAQGPAQFLPGQYAIVSAPGVSERCYSMSNLPNAAGEWEFVVRRVPGGRCSGSVVDAPVGAEFALDGPYGMAYFREEEAGPRDLVCVAGGSGFAPMLSIARAAGDAGRNVHFFYGGRRPRDMDCVEELARLPGFGSRIQLHAAVSSPVEGEDDAWAGERGMLPQLLQSRIGERLLEYRYYAAGAPVLISAIEELLVHGAGLPPERLHYDRFY